MLYYTYSAYNAAGVLDIGSVSAETLADAKALLDIKGLRPFALTQRRNISKLTKSAKRARIAFMRGYATLARAGMNNEEVVEFLLDSVRGGHSSAVLRILGKAMVGMRHEVKRAGSTMGEAMLNQPQLFKSVDAAIVDSSFAAGRLPDTLEEHANELEGDLSFESDLGSSLTQPFVALILGLVMFPFIAGTLVPVLQSLFTSFRLAPPPSFDQMVLVSNASHGPWLWLSYAAIGGGLWYANKTGALGPLTRKTPILGAILRARSTMQGARTLGQAYSAGKSAEVACNFAAATVEDPELAVALQMCAKDLQHGNVSNIAEAMSKHSSVFDPIFIQYMRMARESRVPEMCGHVAANSRRQIRDAVQRLPVIVNNGATLLIGLFIALMAFYIYSAVSYAVGHIGSSPDATNAAVQGPARAGH